MWRVTNKLNRPHLFYYNTRVIIPFWEFWLEIALVKNIRTKILQPNFLENYINVHGSFDIRFLQLTKTNKPTFRTLTIGIVQLGRVVLKREHRSFIAQNQRVGRLDYNFNQEAHPQVLTNIFKLYFYEKGWETAWIWTDVVKIDFDRSIFQENFKLENKLSVCPYCDLTTIPSRRSAWVEHFLPKDKFPYVANNPHNVLPTCNPCNVSGTGKGTTTRNPTTMPYREQIGDTLEFRLITGNIEIQPSGNVETENYLTLLKSRQRYKDVNVKRMLFNTLIVTHDLIMKGVDAEEEENEFQSYIENIGRDQGHYFARRTLVMDIDAVIASKV